MIKEFKILNKKTLNKLDKNKIKKIDETNFDFNEIARLCGYTENQISKFLQNYNVFEYENGDTHCYIASNNINWYIWY